MGTLSRTGYITTESPELKKALTVRALIQNDFAGIPPPPFKVFKESKNGVCVPRFYGETHFGLALVDKRPEPVRIHTTFKGVLRNETHQNEAFDAAITAGHGVLSLPCGFGKTTVALAIACRLGYRTMIIVHKEFLANQWRERIQQFCPGASIGIVQQDKIETGNDFVIAMLQSLAMKEYSFSDFETVGTVIVDEAHHICAKVFSQSLFKMCPKHIYGLSATPERKDGLTKVLHWFMGPTFFSIERENQAHVEVHTVKFDCPLFRDALPCTRNGKPSLVLAITELVNNDARNALLVKMITRITKGSRQLLVLSDRRLHCQALHDMFKDNSGLYMGGMTEAQLKASSTKQIIFGTFSQAHEGLDIPTLDTIFLVTPKSDIKQSIGRILRETHGKKNEPHIYDVLDNWGFLMHAMYKKRLKVYVEGGFQVEQEAIPIQGVCLIKTTFS